MKIAFFKGIHPGVPGIYSRIVRFWTKSQYSHCEITFSDGLSASASFLDGGVRFAQINFDPALWDFVDVADTFEPAARAWFELHKGEKYDILGNLHFIISPVGDDNLKWFCSEAVAAALGIADAWRFDPADLYPVLQRFSTLTEPAPAVAA